MDYHKIDKRIENFVTSLFEETPHDYLPYHNLQHTKTVVKHTQEIAGHYDLSENEMIILFAAAWFHDIGYLFETPELHEEKSVEIMKSFIQDLPEATPFMQEIADCILATKIPHNPQNLLQQIICDGDTYNLGTKEFKKTNELIFQEQLLRHPQISRYEFMERSLQFLRSHQYFTSYCKEILTATKEKNAKNIEEKLNKPNKVEKKAINKKKQKKENKEETVSIDFTKIEKAPGALRNKGIQTMLRLTSQNHLKLSEMADSKANILISVNAIIISVILSVLLRKLAEETYLIIPTTLFLLVSVSTIVVAILATRPKISEGNFTMNEVNEKKINLLFFGNFYKASYEQYDAAMREMMLDTDYLYGSLIKDIYFLGVVLGRKYKLIRIAYNVFMIGIILSVLAFGIATFFADSSTASRVVNGTGSPF